MGFNASDELLGTFVPIAVYWIYSGFYVLLGDLENFRLHTKAEENIKNVASKQMVVKGVLVQQAFQIMVSLLLFAFISDGTGTVRCQPSLPLIIIQFAIAMVVMDTWQYFMHRYMHINKFLYVHVHSKHHSLVVPLCLWCAIQSPSRGPNSRHHWWCSLIPSLRDDPPNCNLLLLFCDNQDVDDHCGLWLPGNLLHMFFNNNCAYHDIHHQLYGNKYNFSQPFFVTWDKILGTHMPYSLEKRAEGGFEARPIKKIH